MQGDMKDECEHALGVVGLHRTEIWMFPQGYSSPLEIDRPYFMEKTVFLLQGEVRLRAVEFVLQNSRTRNRAVEFANANAD